MFVFYPRFFFLFFVLQVSRCFVRSEQCRIVFPSAFRVPTSRCRRFEHLSRLFFFYKYRVACAQRVNERLYKCILNLSAAVYAKGFIELRVKLEYNSTADFYEPNIVVKSTARTVVKPTTQAIFESTAQAVVKSTDRDASGAITRTLRR
uniref:Putative secreted protein n=1 Tax=Ixodes scapularis TaxID=6945 RepID=A0A4D5RX97_IXOSC